VLPRPGNETRQSQEVLDMVLDKISKNGIESLTREEQAVLEEMSRKLRDK
jgi:hypothetical protein